MNSSDNTCLIAPCGMNCAVCIHYLREKNKCTGCRGSDENKPVTRVNCRIKRCEFFINSDKAFCFECKEYPCAKLKHLDNRYKTRYNMSMIENLEYIKDSGIKNFIKHENTRWKCNECGGTICVHKGYCYSCGKIKDKNNLIN
jgi:hypothetical protein